MEELPKPKSQLAGMQGAKPSASAMPNLARPDGALVSLRSESQQGLSGLSDWQIGMELLSRLSRDPGRWQGSKLGWLGAQLQFAFRSALDFHDNRFARRRYLDLYGVLHGHVRAQLPLEGATFVDLGCGGVNPLGLLMVFLALGAKRGIGVDLDEVQDQSKAVMALADVAAYMILDSGSIAWNRPIAREQVLKNLASFDLAKLRRGELEGIDHDRLRFCRNSIYEMSIGDGEADVVMSNAFLEHIPDVRRGIREMARITKRGGFSVHNIDLTDHRRYGGERGPLDFLTESEGAEMVSGSNRLRAHEFVKLFESEGFEVVQVATHNPVGVTEAMRARFVKPFRDMRIEELDPMMVVVVAKRH
jgi:SAM-dependent methyltransferase